MISRGKIVRRMIGVGVAAMALVPAVAGGAVAAARGRTHPDIEASQGSVGRMVGCKISTAVRYGSRGAAVTCVQQRLTELGYAPGPADGIFGLRTRAAVIAFQRATRLYPDGVVGPRTGAAMGIWGTATTPACSPPPGTPDDAVQIVDVVAAGSYAKVSLLTKVNGAWQCTRMNMAGRVGRNGIRPLAQRRSGDGTTPSGVFPLGTMTAPNGDVFQFMGNATNPGVRGGWHQIRTGDCWAATPGRAEYNTLVSRAATACAAPDEYLARIGAYTHVALIGANMGPDRSGDSPTEPPLAAAIFLHRHSYTSTGATKATSGCVSLGATDLAVVMRALVPGQAYFVIR